MLITICHIDLLRNFVAKLNKTKQVYHNAKFPQSVLITICYIQVIESIPCNVY